MGKTAERSSLDLIAAPPDLVIFDLDGTIIDDRSGADRDWVIAASRAAEVLSVDNTRVCVSVLERRNWFWADPLRHAAGRLDLRAASVQIARLSLRDLGIRNEAVASEMGNAYRALRESHLRPFPDALSLLSSLSAQRIPTALITNGESSLQRLKLARFELAQYFSHVVIEGESGIGKPDYRVFTSVLEAFPAARNAWSIGDNCTWDVEPMVKHGFKSVLVSRDRLDPGHQSHPTLLLSSLDPLVEIWR